MSDLLFSLQVLFVFIIPLSEVRRLHVPDGLPAQFFDFVTQSPDNFQITGFSGIDLDLFTDMADVDSYCVVLVARASSFQILS